MSSAFYLLVSMLAIVATRVSGAKQKTLVDQKLYDTLLYYGKYCPTYPKAPCQIPPQGAVVQGYANADPTTAMTLFRSDHDRELVMAFPGTKSLPDFLTDINTQLVPYVGGKCKSCHVHAGVLRSFNAIQPRAQQVLDAAIAAYPSYKVKLAGHSLGAALVKFAYVYFLDQGYDIAAAYSYGEFRVGDEAFADYADTLSGSTDNVQGRYHRVTHADDGVPQTVPTELGFRHSRNEYWFKTGADPTTTYRCYGQEPQDCNNSELGIGVFGINGAHVLYPGINVTGCGGFGL